MKNILKKFCSREFSTKHLILVFVMIFAVSLYHELQSQKTVALKPPIDPTSVDTFIPKGFVLVPIEVKNAAALESIISSHGVVDLYSSIGEFNKTSKKVASRVKILRAPLNPDQFAVLVKEQLAPHVVQNQEPFFVMVQNPKQQKSKIHYKKTRKKNRILTEVL